MSMKAVSPGKPKFQQQKQKKDIFFANRYNQKIAEQAR